MKTIDEDLRKQAVRELSDVHIREFTDVQKVERLRGCLHLSLKSAGKTAVLDCDAVLIAAGLIPRSETFRGISRRANGEVIVNEYMQTNLPNVYACGDVTGPPYLTPVARLQGIIAADNILGKQRKMDYSAIPQSINLGYELGFCSDGSTSARPLTIPGLQDRAPSGRCQPLIPGLPRSWSNRTGRSAASVLPHRVADSLPVTWRFS